MLHQSDFKLGAQELRHLSNENIIRAQSVQKNNIHIVLDHVVDAYNVGSAFRIADSINAKKVWIGGENITTPCDKQVKKSSLNTCLFVDWESIPKTTQIFRENGFFIALEKLKDPQDFKVQDCSNIRGICQSLNIPIYIIIGSESFGISDEVLSQVNTIVEIPMLGINHSMNVINALTLICYSVIGVL